MSFNNDEEGDGLAALFGGVTPQAEPGPRRAAPAPPEPGSTPAAAVPPPGASQPQYPGLAPSASPAYSPPAYSPPATPSYSPPASPAYEMPAPAPQAPLAYDLPAPAVAPAPGASPYEAPATPNYPGLAAPPSYDLPAPGATQYPGIAPSAPSHPATAQYPTGLDPATAFPSAPLQEPSYAPPAYDPPPAYEPPPAYQPSAYQPPPAYEPPPGYEQPPAYHPPAYQPPPEYPPPLAGAPVYSSPAGPGYDLPPAAPLAYPTPLEEPPSYGAPPPSYESFGGPPVLAEPPLIAEPFERPVPEHPLVRSEPALPAAVFPPGPLLPSSTAAVETPEYLERSTAGEKVGLVLAIIAGPIGLAIAIANAIRSGRRRGWLIGVVRASLILGVLSTIAAGIAGYVYWTVRSDQIQHAEIAAASAEFCAAAEADPTMVAPPTLGWPAPGASVSESLTLMQAWTDRWTTLAATSPAGLRTGLELLAERGQTIMDAVTQARTVDDAANQTQIAAAEAQAGVANWHTTYCLEP